MSTGIELHDGFEFGFVKSDEELEELVQFNSSIHNELIANFLKRRLDCLPGFERRMNFYIRDCETGEIVSSMSAIPSTWEYEGIPLKNLEVDCVGTHEEYRNRGFIRFLYQYFDKELQNGDYHISTLQGIPEFFRQFGYDFLFPIGQFSRLVLRPDQVPRIWSDEKPQFMNLDIRDTTDSDLDSIIELYDALGSRLTVRSFRTRELWEIQERTKKWRGFDFETKLVIDDDQVVGYVRYIIHDEKSPMSQVWGSAALDVIESSIVSYNGVMRTLYYLKDVSNQYQLPLIFLPVTTASHLSRLCMDLGGQTEILWKHQIRVPNMVHLLEQIIPALENRLKNTLYSNVNQVLKINTYSNCYDLHFESGKLTLIQEIGRQPWGDLSIRNHDLVRLIFGEFSLHELKKINSDMTVSGELVDFVETLFPKGGSFIHYYYC